ncbi:MAG: hypothetical protein LBH06_01185 [Rikenellaceae bacterium]|jgi:hypothetical protein|nr:hypothetical protein [Rikenellaceae bacterium]
MKSDNIAFDKTIEGIIGHYLQGREFDSHAIINTFIKGCEQEYVKRLTEHKDAKSAFKTFHSRIGKALNRAAKKNLIKKKLKADNNPVLRRSLNIKGYESYNHVWIKL